MAVMCPARRASRHVVGHVVDAPGHAVYRSHMSLAKHKFLLLFLFLLGSLIYYPFAAGENGPAFYAFRLLSALVPLVTVYAVSLRRGLLFLALVLAIPALVEHSLLLHDYSGALPILNIALSFLFDAFIVVVIFRHVFANDKPNAETIFGALCIYLLIGFSFSSIYGLIARVQPHAFYMNPLTNLRTVPTRFDFVYYSFATMTALGPAGITPISDHARSVSIIESLVGLLYLAVLISRLMAAYNGDSRQRYP
jgi:Ion channel